MKLLHFDGDGEAPLKVLCLGAHPDDIEIGCGATLMSMVSSNLALEVHWVVFSGGGSRKQEAKDGAASLLSGVARTEVEVLEYPDGFFPYHGAEIKQRFEVLKEIPTPDLIFTHWEGDRHQDHRLLSELTWNTFRNHLILEYEVPKYDGDLGNPNVFFPVSKGTVEKKIDLLMGTFQTQSQKRWFTRDTFLAIMRLRGVESGSPSGFAEAFHARKLLLSPGLFQSGITEV